jgi:stage II sporulation protein D
VRVVVANDGLVTLTADAAWTIQEPGTDRPPKMCAPTAMWTFRHAGGNRIEVIDPLGVSLGVAANPLEIRSRGAGHLRVGERRYRGVLRIVPAETTLLVVNALPMESYVMGVVGNEIGKGHPSTLEALKAQAVAARTYALRMLAARDPRAPYDLKSSTSDQVYTGVGGESVFVAQAVRETAGEVVTRDGKPVTTYYFSTCGGRTADVDEVWNGRAGKHLEGRKCKGRSGDWCSTSKHHRWEVAWDADAFIRIFSTYYPRVTGTAGPFGELKKLKVRKRGKSGRIRVLEVETTTGKYLVEKDAVRWILRRDEPGMPGLRSTRVDFKVRKQQGRVVRVEAKGRGFGHGVGMCQWGALEMSKAGRSYDKILRYYYRKVKVQRVY